MLCGGTPPRLHMSSNISDGQEFSLRNARASGQLSLPKQCSNRIPNSLSAQTGASAPLQSIPTRSLSNLSNDGCNGHRCRDMPLRLALYFWICTYPLCSQPPRTCPSPSLPIQRSSWEAMQAEATPRQRSPSLQCGVRENSCSSSSSSSDQQESAVAAAAVGANT